MQSLSSGCQRLEHKQRLALSFMVFASFVVGYLTSMKTAGSLINSTFSQNSLLTALDPAGPTTPVDPAQVGWPWPQEMRGAELHRDIGQVVAQKEANSIAALEILNLAAPEPRRCQCRLERWDQYAACSSAIKSATKAVSLGVNGYDPWGKHLQRNHGLLPRAFDCFNTKIPVDFQSDFAAVCMAAKAGTWGGRRYDTIASILEGATNGSVLLKMDVEESEWSILESLSEADLAKITSLHVEYHFNYRCPSVQDLARARAIMQKVRQHFAVVDGAAGYYTPDCFVDGTAFPKLLAVSYMAKPFCTPAGTVFLAPSEAAAVASSRPDPLAIFPQPLPPLFAASVSAASPSYASEVGWSWPSLFRNAELHRELGQVIALGGQSEEALEVFRLLAPEAARCHCQLERWDQYAVCKAALQGATRALSLGINGYDPWGKQLQQVYGLVPRGFDCFNTNKPAGFEINFSTTCIGGVAEVVEGRQYDTLPNQLEGIYNRSVLVKMDIELSEWSVLESLSALDWDHISSLHVEYHFNYICPDEQSLALAKRTMALVRSKLAVVDSAAAYYENPGPAPHCFVGGKPFPKLFAVSYNAEESCSSTPAAGSTTSTDRRGISGHASASAADLSKAVWQSDPVWVDKVFGQTTQHSDWSWGAHPALCMDSNVETYAGFLGASGFLVLDTGTPLSALRLRLRGDGDSADVRSLQFKASSTLQGPWVHLALLEVSTEPVWQESHGFVSRAQFFKLEWTSNHGARGGTRIVDLELLISTVGPE